MRAVSLPVSPVARNRKDSTPRHGRLLQPSSWAERDDRDHHWRLAQSALAAGLLGRVLTAVLTGQCATLWPPNAGWPTEWQQNNGMVCCVTPGPSGWRAVTSDWRHREPTGAPATVQSFPA